MLTFGKKARESRAAQVAEHKMLLKILRSRIRSTLDGVLNYLDDIHNFSQNDKIKIQKSAENIRNGFDVVLINEKDVFGKGVPENLVGGAIIANSAHAFYFLSISIEDEEGFNLIGSLNDKETTGHICYQLGFSRDGLAVRG